MSVSDQRAQVRSDRRASIPAPSGSGWLAAARTDAADRLDAVGLPGRRDEYWRYTDPAPFAAAEPMVSGAPSDEAPLADVDGAFVVTLADGAAWDASDVPAGLEVSTLSQAGDSDIHWAADLFGRLEAMGSRPVTRPFATLNTAGARDGLVIRATGSVERPVVLRYCGGPDMLVHNVLRVEDGASVTVIETGDGGARHGHVLEVDLRDESALHHVRLQGRAPDRHAQTHLFARLSARAALRSFTLSAGGALTRNEGIVAFEGDDARASIAGAAIGTGRFHHDDTVFVTHGALRCESRQIFKKVLRSGATGVFQGKILVKEGAQRTDGYQMSQALLLDDDSVFLAKPELEIYADDVACSHGSTTGAIDETALFYLRSRGVPHDAAVDLLVLSFLAEAVGEIDDDTLRARVGDVLAEWLRG